MKETKKLKESVEKIGMKFYDSFYFKDPKDPDFRYWTIISGPHQGRMFVFYKIKSNDGTESTLRAGELEQGLKGGNPTGAFKMLKESEAYPGEPLPVAKGNYAWTCSKCGENSQAVNTSHGMFSQWKNGMTEKMICWKCRKNTVHKALIKEGFYKPGGKEFGIHGDLLKNVKCQKCKGTGDWSPSKTRPGSCPKCKGVGSLRLDPAYKQKDDDWMGEDEKIMCPKCKEKVEPEGKKTWHGFESACPQCGHIFVELGEEGSTVAGIGGFNGPMIKKKIKETRGRECDACGKPLGEKDYEEYGSWSYTCPECDFKYNHKSSLSPEEQMHGSKKKLKESKEMKTHKQIIQEIDLSRIKGSLSNFLAQASQTGELQKQFGSNYDANGFIDWLKQKIESFDLKISDKYVNQMKSKMKDMTPLQAQSYAYNALLKGADMGLNEATITMKNQKFDDFCKKNNLQLQYSQTGDAVDRGIVIGYNKNTLKPENRGTWKQSQDTIIFTPASEPYKQVRGTD